MLMRVMHRLTPRAALASLLCAFTLLAAASQASAAPSGYGELTRFGPGAGPGETLGTLNDEHRTRLLGVDSSDNSVYVLDEPLEEEQEIKEIHRGRPGCPEELEEEEPCEIGVGPFTRHFRIQKFAASGGSYSPVATTPLAEQDVWPAKLKRATAVELETASAFEEEIGRSRGLAVEGIAVDPVLGRVYVLAAELRLPTLPIDNAAVEQPLLERKAIEAAATLYAYSTHQSGGALQPAVGGTPVLTSSATLGAQSGVSGQPLLEPAGITVDPETHDVIILGHVDDAGAPTDQIESASDHYALQRIHADGTLGARYVDKTNFFGKEATNELRPHSPIVVGPAKSEHVYVGYKRGSQPAGIVEVPDNFESSAPPKNFFTPPPESIVEEWIKTPAQAEGPNVLGPIAGGALTASPEGTIFTAGLIHLEEHGLYQAVVALSGADGSIKGWTGGQAQNPTASPETRYLCVIEPLFYNPSTPIAAGSGGAVFVLAPGYLFDRNLINPHEIEFYGPPAAPAVIEFGPGGSGCPAAKSKELTATLRGVPLEGRSVNEGEQVGFSAKLAQADALSVEWDFGDGSKETISPSKKPMEVLAKHAFKHGGSMTVTATIQTDDLATPTITLTTHLTVEGKTEETQKEKEERERKEKEQKEKEKQQKEKEEKERKEKEEHETQKEKEEREQREHKEKEQKEKQQKEKEERERKEKEEHEGSGVTALGLAPGPAYVGVPALFDGSASSDSAGANQITEYHWEFGDGGEYDGPASIVFHTYAFVGEYIASLRVKDRRGLHSAPYSLFVRVQPPQGPPQALPSIETSSVATVSVAGSTYTAPATIPVVTISSALLPATPAGTVSLLLYCPADEHSCAGTVTLRTAMAIAGSKVRHLKTPATTLAKGTFALKGGQQKRVVLHLSRAARALLARVRDLHSQALLEAHDQAGATHTTRLAVVVRAASTHGKH
jgi:PKD repeat protein